MGPAAETVSHTSRTKDHWCIAAPLLYRLCSTTTKFLVFMHNEEEKKSVYLSRQALILTIKDRLPLRPKYQSVMVSKRESHQNNSSAYKLASPRIRSPHKVKMFSNTQVHIISL